MDHELLDQKQIGKRILKLRSQQHLTQSELAEILDVTGKHIGCVERGESTLSTEKLLACSRYFDVSLDYLVCGYGADTITDRHLPLEFVQLFHTVSEQEYTIMYEHLRTYIRLRHELKK